ncbi:MAG: hypothetical protein U0R52_10055 [Solirubrobacterales bacterium]
MTRPQRTNVMLDYEVLRDQVSDALADAAAALPPDAGDEERIEAEADAVIAMLARAGVKATEGGK